MEFELNEWLEYARGVAKSYGNTYKRLEADDIYQELAIELITKEDRLTEVFPTMQNPAGYTKVILKNAAWRYCTSENRKHIVQTDFYEYQTADVKVMIEQYLAGTKEGMMVPDDAKSVHGDDDLAIFGDIARVVDALPEADQQTLQTYFFVADAKEVAERQRFSRVVRKVTNTLNYQKQKATLEYEGTGSRKVMSNRQSLAVAKTGYNMKEKDYA